jgi:hypothetical protein
MDAMTSLESAVLSRELEQGEERRAVNLLKESVRGAENAPGGQY